MTTKTHRKSLKKIDIGTLRHHVVSVGNMDLCNGFGVRYGCHMCVDGEMLSGEQCWICNTNPPRYDHT